MTPKERMITAIKRGIPDRVPVTTHHIMPYFLNKYMGGINNEQFFDYFDLDPIVWAVPYRTSEDGKEYFDPSDNKWGPLSSKKIFSDEWRITEETIYDPHYQTVRYRMITPKGELTTVMQSNEYTTWVVEHLIKQKRDIDLIEYATHPKCDVNAVNNVADKYGDSTLIRGHISYFDIFGQPGCWQDASCLFGIEKLIIETYDDSEWVHQFLRILQDRKKTFIRSLKGAKYDILELGGGDASSTVISPKIFDEFVAPYDSELIKLAHEAGQRIVYHTCGGMMPILENIAAMGPDAVETLTPSGMGGDTRLKEAKKKIGEKVCMIGGFDQFHFLKDCTPEQTRAEVRRCFAEAGENGGYILCTSDHFFDADIELIKVFSDEAHKCFY